MQTIIDTADGADSLWMNQLYTIASGGDFWESGGGLSSAGSSTDIQLSVSSVTVNIGGSSVTHGSQPVTLSATSGEYRADVIYADSSGIGKQEGVEMPKLPTDNQFPSIWQPAPDNGSLVAGVPLHVVHVTPSDAASADIESWQQQNRRMNAESINTDAVVSLLEEYDTAANGPVQTTVSNATEFDGRGPAGVYGGASPTTISERLPSGGASLYHVISVPANHQFHLYRYGAISVTGQTNQTVARIVSFTSDGSINATEVSTDSASTTMDFTLGPGRYGLQARNTATTEEAVTASFFFVIEPV